MTDLNSNRLRQFLAATTWLLVTLPAQAQDTVQQLVNAADWRSAVRAVESGSGRLLSGSVAISSPSGWLYFQLESDDTALLRLSANTLGDFAVYSLESDVPLAQADDSSNRSPYRHPETTIELDSSWGNEFLLRLDVTRDSTIPFSFITETEARSQMSGRMLGDGIYYGAIGLMAIFAFASSLFNRDSHTWRLGVCLSSWLVTVFSAWGFGDLILPLAVPEILAALSIPLIAVASITSCWFCWHFMRDSAAGSPLLLGLRLTLYASLLYLAYAAYFGFTQFTTTLLMLSTGFFAVTSAVVSALRGDAAAKYLVAAACSTVSPFIVLLRSPPSQQFTIFIGVSALILVTMAVLRRQSERHRENELQVEVARERERFLASMSHEIRTPLNGIIGFSELCDTSQLTGETKEYFEQIERSSRMLLSIVNDVLDYSKLEANEISVQTESMSVEKTLENVITIVKPLALTNRVKLSFSIADGVAEFVVTDPHRCAQVLINLLSNAVKFTQDGRVTVDVQRETDQLIFNVIDSGIGIDARTLDSLFDPFKQADADTARRFGGTGLGLAISKQLAALLGGELSAVSTVNKGSTFTLRIPYQRGKAPPVKTESRQHFNLEGLNVLLAEDNAVNRMLATRILENSGVQVDHAIDGKAAVEKATENSYDVILMDMQMPELSGTEATERLRELGCKSPIIAMTANTADSDRSACIDSGMNDYLAKPIAQSLLLQKLELWSTAQQH